MEVLRPLQLSASSDFCWGGNNHGNDPRDSEARSVGQPTAPSVEWGGGVEKIAQKS